MYAFVRMAWWTYTDMWNGKSATKTSVHSTQKTTGEAKLKYV